MPRLIAQSNLNATTLNIMNVIRENAGYEYQSEIPKVTKESDVPIIGERIYASPTRSNQFLNALVNRISLVAVQSATFNNPYRDLKKGYLEFGESVEEIFVKIADVVKYDPEKAPARELKRTIPDVLSTFHIMNWRTMYPVTIQNEDLKMAFLSVDGVRDLIAKIVDQVYTAAQYDEFLLFKYMIIKALAHGKIHTTSIGAMTNFDDSAIEFRAISNTLPFMKSTYNEEGVLTTTPKERQVIFMDARFNAQFDVKVLASAFNMDKADFMGRLYLIDDFTIFDNDRFSQIRAESTGIEEVTAEELALMKDLKAIIFDTKWFQVYDNLNKFTETYVSSGLYWNYFYHTWKTVSWSPFANAVAFVTDLSTIANPASITVEITDKNISENGTILSMVAQDDSASLQPTNLIYQQTEDLTKALIGVLPYGSVIIPANQAAKDIKMVAKLNEALYQAQSDINAASAVGATFTMKPITVSMLNAPIDSKPVAKASKK